MSVKGLAACVVIVLVGGVLTFAIPAALELYDGLARLVMAGCAAMTLTSVLLVARRGVGRPYVRKPIVRTALLAPIGVIGVCIALIALFAALGADCPGAGMDYISECNDLATASMIVSGLGVFALGISVLVALIVGTVALIKRYGRPRPRLPRDGREQSQSV